MLQAIWLYVKFLVTNVPGLAASSPPETEETSSFFTISVIGSISSVKQATSTHSRSARSWTISTHKQHILLTRHKWVCAISKTRVCKLRQKAVTGDFLPISQKQLTKFKTKCISLYLYVYVYLLNKIWLSSISAKLPMF